MTTPGHDTGPSWDHPGDLLSALLDDELDARTATLVVAHVDTCPPCAAELEAVGAVRRTVRSLPPVEPPTGFVASLLEPTERPVDGSSAAPDAVVVSLGRRRQRSVLAGAAASVAAVVAVVTLGLVDVGAVSPPVEEAMTMHASTVSALRQVGVLQASGGPDPLWPRGDVTPSTRPPEDPSAFPPPFSAPDRLDGGYRLVAGFRDGEAAHLLYVAGQHRLSVIEVVGRCDFDALPGGGRRVEVGSAQGWRPEWPGMDGRLVVLERGDVTVVALGDEPGEAVLEAVSSMPASPPLPVVQRLVRGAEASLRQLAPTG